MARACGAGRIVACEPNPAVVPRLRENLKLNALSNVAVVPRAITSRAGRVTLHVPNDVVGLQAWASLRGSHDQYLGASHTISVDGATLDDIVADSNLNQVRLIKIDTEGLEPEVIYGGRSVLAEQTPALVFEYTRTWWTDNGHTLTDVLGWLQGIGYRTFSEIGADGLRPINPGAEVSNILARI
jgi:FkbM family methyltransferase